MPVPNAGGKVKKHMGKMRVVIMILVLVLNSVHDWKYRKISISVTVSGIIFSVFLLVFVPAYTWQEVLGGIGIGIFFIFCSCITRGQIGIGDGIICCFAGLCSGFSDTMGMVFIGLFLSGIVSAGLLITKKAGKNTKIPLVPFFLAGYFCMKVMKI